MQHVVRHPESRMDIHPRPRAAMDLQPSQGTLIVAIVALHPVAQVLLTVTTRRQLEDK